MKELPYKLVPQKAYCRSPPIPEQPPVSYTRNFTSFEKLRESSPNSKKRLLLAVRGAQDTSVKSISSRAQINQAIIKNATHPNAERTSVDIQRDKKKTYHDHVLRTAPAAGCRR